MNHLSTHKGELTSYTIIQLFAARLIKNQAKNDIPFDLSTQIITTKQVMPDGATNTHTNQQPNMENENDQ